MSQRLTYNIVKGLPVPATGNKITFDTEVTGLGARVTAAGGRSFIFNYRRKSDGVERRYTIGAFPDWSVAAAREEARALRRRVDTGGDPLGEHRAEREAPTVTDLCDRFVSEHVSRKRHSTAMEYRALIENDIKPALGQRKVAAIEFADIDRLHRKITKRAPYRANRAVAVLSKMFSFAIHLRWCTDNPCKGIERNDEAQRHRYLSADELARLTAALAEDTDQQAANIFRLLLLTGARRGEVLAARWDQFDLNAGVWTKLGATTKQKSLHRVPLSAPARQLIAGLDRQTEYLFPGDGPRGHRVNVKGAWTRICKAAGITGLRIHDLRHSYASQLVSAGFSLPVIGALLGHSQVQTTARYSHLFDDVQRKATETVGAIITGKPSADVVPLKGGRSWS
jgi:integrase